MWWIRMILGVIGAVGAVGGIVGIYWSFTYGFTLGRALGFGVTLGGLVAMAIAVYLEAILLITVGGFVVLILGALGYGAYRGLHHVDPKLSGFAAAVQPAQPLPNIVTSA